MLLDQSQTLAKIQHRVPFLFLLLSFLIMSPSPASAKTTGYLPEQGELFEQALAEEGLTPEDVYLDRADMGIWGGDKYRLKMLDVFFENPWKLSAYSRIISDRLLAKHDNLGAITTSAHIRLDASVRLALIGNPLGKFKKRVEEHGSDALAIALEEITGKPAASFQNEEYEALPAPLRDAVAQFLWSVSEVLRFRDLGLLQPLAELGLDADRTYAEVVDYLVQTWDEQDKPEEASTIEQVLMIESLLDKVDFPLLNAGAALSAIAAQELQRQLSDPQVSSIAGSYHYTVETPLGKIILSGGGEQVYPPDDYLLLVDVAGDDIYQGSAATRNINQGISITIDLSGNDIYQSSAATEPSFGAGIFGYGILIDVQGDDRYEAQFLSQGSGIFGTGILYDVEGSDTYKGIGNLQGSGSFGTELLVDNGGDDRYELYKYGQGYGYTKGFGLLLDSAGSDRYIGLEETNPNGGPFGAENHIHFAQGAGYGRRGDYSDGHSWAGGIGMLVDGGGSDRYECEIYCQGSAYWYALGFLMDKAGDDYYHGGWYSLGSSPHFGVALFQDDSGDDRYTGIMTQSLGNGRDWSIGWFEDSAGDDWYQGSHMTFGTGDANGIGVFWDRSGNDTYLSLEKLTHGQSRMEPKILGSLRELMLTLGLFVDGDGDDAYLLLPENFEAIARFQGEITTSDGLRTHPLLRNNSAWRRPTQKNEVPGAYGSGIDAQGK